MSHGVYVVSIILVESQTAAAGKAMGRVGSLLFHEP
jgi:hypothetical protein